MPKAYITGIGTAVPPHAIAQPDALAQMADFCAADADQRRAMSRVYLHAGVQSRHSVVLESPTNGAPARQSFYVPNGGASTGGKVGEQCGANHGPTTDARMRAYEAGAAPLALMACRAALADAKALAGEITHLVTISCSGFSAPGVDFELIASLGLSVTVERTHVGFMGCHGALNGLRVARALVEADASACVLLCAVELCTLHLQGGFTMQRAVSNALFADGAAALVVRSQGGTSQKRTAGERSPARGIDAGMVSAGAGDSACRDGEEDLPLCERTLNGATGLVLAATGACVIPDSADAMTWRIGDRGFEMTLSPRVPDYICAHLPAWLNGWLGRHGLVKADVAAWAVHPGGPRILSAFCDAMGLPREAVNVSEEVLAQFGNMSSPTILFILERLWRSEIAGPIVALGFGPGLAVEAALLRMPTRAAVDGSLDC